MRMSERWETADSTEVAAAGLTVWGGGDAAFLGGGDAAFLGGGDDFFRGGGDFLGEGDLFAAAPVTMASVGAAAGRGSGEGVGEKPAGARDEHQTGCRPEHPIAPQMLPTTMLARMLSLLATIAARQRITNPLVSSHLHPSITPSSPSRHAHSTAVPPPTPTRAGARTGTSPSVALAHSWAATASTRTSAASRMAAVFAGGG